VPCETLARRIIACLDVDRGRVVKGVCFADIADAGDPTELAWTHSQQGADEIIFLDITATSDNRAILIESVRRTAEELFIPLTVGGGIRSLQDAASVFDAGADKVAVNSAALHDPALITRIAQRFGSQAVVVAIDARRSDRGGYDVFASGGRTRMELDVVAWVVSLSLLPEVRVTCATSSKCFAKARRTLPSLHPFFTLECNRPRN